MKNQGFSKKRPAFRERIEEFFASIDVPLFGVASLQTYLDSENIRGGFLPKAISFAVPMSAKIMGGIKQGPTRKYAEEYQRVNQKINSVSLRLASCIEELGYAAKALPASERTDSLNLKGDFPHKTAATLAGLGWIGRNCQLITKDYGPWIRLGTVFTDLPVESDEPVSQSYCGNCQICVEACPADALWGDLWYPGIPREKVLEVWRCDTWKKKHYFHFNNGHNCGICAAVCPFGK